MSSSKMCLPSSGAERSKAMYEPLPHYPKPPLMTLPKWQEVDDWLQFLQMRKGSFVFGVNKLILRLIDFHSFLSSPANKLEQMLRFTDMRSGVLSMPTISATIALDDDPRRPTPLQRAANLLIGLRQFYHQLMNGQFPPDRQGEHVLEMGQYPNLFGVCRTVEKSGVKIYKSRDTEHVAVIVRGTFYRVRLWPMNTELNCNEIAQVLGHITAQAPSTADERSPALLTCAGSTTQMRCFGRLAENSVYRQSIELLKDCFAVLCLDLDDRPNSLADAALSAHVGNPENRWYHAGLQLVVFGNARACAICNFSTYLDGNTMMRGAATLYQNELKLPPSPVQPAETPSGVSIERLVWQVPPAMLLKARQEFEMIRDHQQATFTISGVGRRFFLAHDIEAVPAFIVALSMTAYRLTSRHVHIMQFLALSRYRCMDLTTADVNTQAVQECVDCLLSDAADFERGLRLLVQAVKSQIEQARRARHFLSLPEVLPLHMMSQRGLMRVWTRLLLVLRLFINVVTGHAKKHSRDILVSHPEIYPGTPIVGRPGVKLPYVNCFGLHYQIFENEIVITMMPGMVWRTPNHELIAELERNLKCIMDLISRAKGDGSQISATAD